MEKKKMENMIEEMLLTGAGGNVYSRIIGDTEKQLIEKALKRSFGNQSIAAKILGINRNTLRSKIKKLKINVREYRI